jgi:FG-GAP-like repeat
MKNAMRFIIFGAIYFLNIPVHAQRLHGFADMHTHPMSHLAFGGMIMYGAPDIGTLMLKGQKYRGWHSGAKNCNDNNEPAGSLEHALGFDNQIHGGPGFGTTSFGDANNCGDVIRTAIIDKLEEKYIHKFPNPGLAGEISGVNDHPHHGYPNFTHWPHWSSVTHQQMYWEWIKRAYDGGLRVMVALAVNNSLLAKAANAEQYIDDKSSVDLQLQEIKLFVSRHNFMAIAYSPSDLRRIVQNNKLAVILGVETDDFGNLTKRANFRRERITPVIVNAEIRHLYDQGVRYIIPIHLSNSLLGGYAIGKSLFALNSKEYTNKFPEPRVSCEEGVHFVLKREEDLARGLNADLLRSRDLGWIIDHQPTYSTPRSGCGHANSLPLTELGKGAIQTMMNLGMMIDIDHMSRQVADKVLEIANSRNYPINSGHNGLLPSNCISGRGIDPEQCTENLRTKKQYEMIRKLDGLVGLGHGGKATNFVRNYHEVLELMGNNPVAIGTDVNGLEALPAPDPQARIRYDASFPKYSFGNRTWDVNSRTNAAGQEIGDGFAHYGLFPDYIRSWQASSDPATRMTSRAMEAFMSSAEGFAQMWEKSVRRSTGSLQTDFITENTNWCTHRNAYLLTGDFNGDGAEDLLCRDPGRLWIDYADNHGKISGTTDWHLDTRWCTHANAKLMLGDFNGDGRTDMLCRDPARISINYADSQGRFHDRTDWHLDTRWCTHANAKLMLGDFNGDGRTDMLCRDPARISINYADSQGRFHDRTDWHLDTRWCTHANAKLMLGDFSGDGRTDMLCRDPARISINYADSQGRFHDRTDWHLDTRWCTHANAKLMLGDFNGDGRTDMLCRDPARISINYADSQGRFHDRTDWHLDTRWCTEETASILIADINGDNRKDLVCRNGELLQINYASIDSNAEGQFISPIYIPPLILPPRLF